MKLSRMLNSPIVLPIIFFVIVILLGSILLHSSEKNKIDRLSWTDAAFTATSAACVTGLVVVDTGSYFTQFGQVPILLLMQIGGLGIMTFTSLSIYIWRRRTTITDRIAVGQTMVLTLSCDHRVVDGALGAQYLGALKQLLEAPSLLLL